MHIAQGALAASGKMPMKHSVTGFDFAIPANHRKTVTKA
jgi:hypothetical protein